MFTKTKKICSGYMRFLGGVFKSMQKNLWTLLWFSMICTGVLGLSMITLKSLMLDLTFSFYGEAYVSLDNLLSFLLYPTTIIVLLVMDFLLGYAMMFEISGMLYIYRCSHDGKKAKLKNTVLSAIGDCNRLAKPKNLPFLFLLILVIPFSATIPLSVVGIAVSLPEFINDAIVANKIFRIPYYAAIIGLIILALTYIFAFPRFVNEDDNFSGSTKFARKLIRKRKLKTYLSLIATSFIFSAAFFLLSIGIFALYAFIKAKINYIPLTGSLISGYSDYMNLLNTALVSIFLPVVTCATLSQLYFKFTENDGIKSEAPPMTFKYPKVKIISFILVIALILSALICSLSASVDGFFDKSERSLVVAHRGDSLRAPENSMPAFELAITESAQMLELDIYQTKDKQLVVCHDNNLSRVTGKNVCVHEMTVSEIQALDSGSWFSDKFSYVRISTLEEVLQAIKGKFDNVQIEIKYAGHEDKIEEELVRLIDKYEMRDEITVISLNPVPLQRIKEIDSDIHTAYCMAIAWGDIENIDFSDDFTIEESNVEPMIVAKIHKEGKKVYAWTCNTADNVQWLLDCGIDGIVTDDPIMLEEALDNCDYSGGVARLLRVFFYELKYGV